MPEAPGSTLVDELHRAAAGTVGVHFIDRREREHFLGYAEILDRAERAARGLRALGIEPGDRVACLLRTEPDFYSAFFGAVLAGAVPVPLYPPVRLGNLDEYHRRTAGMLRASRARVVVTSRLLRGLVAASVEAAEPDLGCTRIARLPTAQGSLPEPHADDTALIQFSSGTTVDPKPVELTHRQILANLNAVREHVLEVLPEDDGFRHSGVSWLPLYHDMGLIGGLLHALQPGPLALMPPEVFLGRPALWLRAVSRHRATITGGPNFAFRLCLERVRDSELEGVDLSSLRLLLDGAEPIVPDVLRDFVARFRRFGLRDDAITPVYGLAEATLAVTFSPVAKPFRATSFDREALAARGRAVESPAGRPLVSVGAPLPGVELRVADDARVSPERPGPGGPEHPLGPERLGRIWVRGPSVMKGYAHRREATRRAIRNGWLDTGDTGFLHDGELYLYGRAKDLIVIRGHNHSPVEIEQALEGMTGLRACAAVGHVPEGATGEELWLFLERDESSAPVATELWAEASRRVSNASGLRAARVEVVGPGVLPRTSSGKVRRRETLRRWLDGQLEALAPGPEVRLAAARLRTLVGARDRGPRSTR